MKRDFLTTMLGAAVLPAWVGARFLLLHRHYIICLRRNSVGSHSLLPLNGSKPKELGHPNSLVKAPQVKEDHYLW